MDWVLTFFIDWLIDWCGVFDFNSHCCARGDCTTQTQLLALKAESKGRLGAKSVNDEYLTDDGSPRRKKQKTGTRATLRVGSEFRPADLHDLEVTGNIFEGKEFLVAGSFQKQINSDSKYWFLSNLTNWLVVHFSIDWLIDWLIESSIDWMNEWLIEWLIDWSIDWSTNRLTDWLIDWLIDVYWFICCRGWTKAEQTRPGATHCWERRQFCSASHEGYVLRR